MTAPSSVISRPTSSVAFVATLATWLEIVLIDSVERIGVTMPLEPRPVVLLVKLEEEMRWIASTRYVGPVSHCQNED